VPGFWSHGRPLLLGVLLIPQVAAAAGPASANLLPNTTKQHLVLFQFKSAASNWQRTQLAQLWKDPKFKPFAEDLTRQMFDPFGLDIPWDAYRAVAGGEVSWAVVQTEEGKFANVLTLDAVGKGIQAAAFLPTMADNLKKHGWESTTQSRGDDILTVFVRQEGTGKQKRVVFVRKDDVVIVCDDLAVVEGILARWKGGTDSLANAKAYIEVQKRSQPPEQEKPDLFLFIEPVGWAASQQASSTQPARRTDLVKQLKREGFDGFQAVGGFIQFPERTHDVLFRTAAYAPPPYQKSMRMFRFFGDQCSAPLPWVPGDVALHAVADYDAQKGFAFIDSLMDAALNDRGGYQAAIDKIRDDPDGPQVDIPREIFARLGRRLTVLADAEKPTHFHSDRMALAFETTDEKGLAAAVKRLLEKDPDVKSHLTPKKDQIWEILRTEKKRNNREDGVHRGKTPNGAVAVARGHLFVASHLQLLEKILAGDAEPLTRQEDWERVARELDKVSPGKECLRLFGRTDEMFRTGYEFLRHNQLAEAPSYRAQLFSMFVEGGGGRKVDGRKLPEFQHAAAYLGLAGMAVANEPDQRGWLTVGFILKK
jgi:hypothetical protein